MNFGKYEFNKLLIFVNKYEFNKCIKRYRGKLYYFDKLIFNRKMR